MRLLTVGCLALALLGCGGSEPEPESSREWVEYEMRGEVVELKDGEQMIAVIDHEEIGEWMGAMTMGFPVRDREEFDKLSEGARIKATVMARGHAEYYLDGIEVIEAANEDEAESEEQAPDGESDE